MKVYIVQSRKKITPFDDHPGDCLIGNKPLTTLQKKIFLDLGLKPVFIPNSSKIDDPNEHVLVNDNLHFTRELLEEFIESSKKQKSCTTCALKSGLVTLRTITSTQEVKTCQNHTEYNLYYLTEEKFRRECRPLVIDPDQFRTSIPMPKHVCDNEEYSMPLTDKFIIQIDHWVNLWAANIITLLADIARFQKMTKIKQGILALKARSLDRWKILQQLNQIGKNCDIHPTAYIEASTIRDNVKIGAGAIIRGSVIGSNSFIGNGVVVEESVIGERNTILNGHVLYSVLYPGTFAVAQFISASLIGKDTFIGANVTLTDFRLDGENVSVIKDGAKIDTGNKFIGSCLGHGVYLGAGCIIAPGRTIPKNTRITPERSRVISKCDSMPIAPGFRLIKQHKSLRAP